MNQMETIANPAGGLDDLEIGAHENTKIIENSYSESHHRMSLRLLDRIV